MRTVEIICDRRNPRPWLALDRETGEPSMIAISLSDFVPGSAGASRVRKVRRRSPPPVDDFSQRYAATSTPRHSRARPRRFRRLPLAVAMAIYPCKARQTGFTGGWPSRLPSYGPARGQRGHAPG